MIDVVRKNCTAGNQTTFKFKTTAVCFLVKNFTSAAVLVCLGKWDESQAVMVGSGIAETIASNSDPASYMTRNATATVIVRSEASGTVEVIRYD